jgi:hypothetical protein
MRFSLALLAVTVFGQQALAGTAEKNNQWAWSHDGNLCELPKGSYENSCKNATVKYCTNLNELDTPCMFSVDCFTENAPYNLSHHNEVFLPRAVTFLEVKNANGSLSHPGMNGLMQQQDMCKLECNPCTLPTGNYVNSCRHVSMHYLDWEDSATPCLMLADCDPRMRHDVNRKLGSTGFIHNEVLFGTGLNFSFVKNLYGRLIHPSEQFKTITDMCFERGSTELVAESIASMRTVSKAVAGVAAVALAYVIS